MYLLSLPTEYWKKYFLYRRLSTTNSSEVLGSREIFQKRLDLTLLTIHSKTIRNILQVFFSVFVIHRPLSLTCKKTPTNGSSLSCLCLKLPSVNVSQGPCDNAFLNICEGHLDIQIQDVMEMLFLLFPILLLSSCLLLRI